MIEVKCRAAQTFVIFEWKCDVLYSGIFADNRQLHEMVIHVQKLVSFVTFECDRMTCHQTHDIMLSRFPTGRLRIDTSPLKRFNEPLISDTRPPESRAVSPVLRP